MWFGEWILIQWQYIYLIHNDWRNNTWSIHYPENELNDVVRNGRRFQKWSDITETAEFAIESVLEAINQQANRHQIRKWFNEKFHRSHWSIEWIDVSETSDDEQMNRRSDRSNSQITHCMWWNESVLGICTISIYRWKCCRDILICVLVARIIIQWRQEAMVKTLFPTVDLTTCSETSAIVVGRASSNMK